jgi:hypothetical protein
MVAFLLVWSIGIGERRDQWERSAEALKYIVEKQRVRVF